MTVVTVADVEWYVELLGAATGVVLFLIALAEGLARRPDLITPQAWRAERSEARPAGRTEPDGAWPCYPYRQARADLDHVRNVTRRLYYARLARWPADSFFRGRHGGFFVWWVLLIPFTLAALLWLAATGLTLMFCYAVFMVVTRAWMTAGAGIHAGLTATARAVEWSWHRWKHADASCPVCFRVTPRPAYRCPKCSELHHDLRPGRFGLVIRRCACGAHLPSIARRAAWRLAAVCQTATCGEPLPRGTGALRGIRIVVFGAASAGKTRYLYAGLNSLVHEGTPRVGFPDGRSRDRADHGLEVIGSGADTERTGTADPAVALTARVGSGSRAALVQLFDIAGRNYQDPEMYDSLGFLPRGQGFAYVLDPFAIPRVAARVIERDTTALPAHTAAGDPETAYRETVMRMRDDGVSPAHQRLAVIVAKADLLRAAGEDMPTGSDGVAGWLADAGMHNFVLATGRDFAEVRYFTAASVPPEDAPRDDPGAPLRWLLGRFGAPIPPAASTETTTAGRGGAGTAVPAPTEAST